MLLFDFVTLPTLSDLTAAAPWALGGGLACACIGALYMWHEGRSMMFGPVDTAIGPPPEVPGMPPLARRGLSWRAVVGYGAVGAVTAAGFAISTRGYDAAFGFLGITIALIALLRALTAVIHQPLALVPVGEPPPETDSDDEKLAKPGTWAAVGAAAVGLVFAALQMLG